MLARLALGLAVGIALAGAAPGAARACSEDGAPIAWDPVMRRNIYGYDDRGAPIYTYVEPEEDPLYWWEGALLAQGAVNLALLGADIAFAAEDVLPPREYATLEVAAAVVNAFATAIWGVVGFLAATPTCGRSTDRVFEIPIASGVSHLFSVTFFIHGHWALNRQNALPRVAPSVSIGPSGFSIGVSGLLE